MICSNGICNFEKPTVCHDDACFPSEAKKGVFESINNCFFTPEKKCDPAQATDAQSCCVESLQAKGNYVLVDKVNDKNSNQFDWEKYKKQCKNMKPREGENKKCVVGTIPNPKTDDWPIQEVVQNPNNPNALPYCVDGCSLPPMALNLGIRFGVAAINATHDNPTGHSNSSFYEACKAHDICYQTCDKNINEENCDTNLLQNALAVCEKIPDNDLITIKKYNITRPIQTFQTVNAKQFCQKTANEFYEILSPKKLGQGQKAFKQRRQEMCQCC